MPPADYASGLQHFFAEGIPTGRVAVVEAIAVISACRDHHHSLDEASLPQGESNKMAARESRPMIEAVGLSKYYGDFAAVENVTFSIHDGEVVAFLGPNGAGKSTTMKLLTGYLAPSAGTARIAGYDMSSQRLEGSRRLGYLPENGPLYLDMPPIALLRFFAEARGIPPSERTARIREVVELCSLEGVLGKPIGKLSRGYRQRVGMAQVLLHQPDVLIMDEPTAGLDPNQIHEVRETIRRLMDQNKTILLSTHILQEVEAMATRVLFINEGRLVFDGSVEAVTRGGRPLDQWFREMTTAAEEAVAT